MIPYLLLHFVFVSYATDMGCMVVQHHVNGKHAFL